jgi:hypothetical protein
MLLFIKTKLRNWLTRELIITTNPQDVFEINKGIFLLGGEQMSLEEIRSIQEEVKFVEKTRLWKIITATLEDDAREKMFIKSTSFDDMWAGKMMLYNIDVQKKIMKAFKTYLKR